MREYNLHGRLMLDEADAFQGKNQRYLRNISRPINKNRNMPAIVQNSMESGAKHSGIKPAPLERYIAVDGVVGQHGHQAHVSSLDLHDDLVE